MSKYENYTKTASHYDTTRSAIGSEIWLGHLFSNFNNPAEVKLLDAGCGTGNYTLALAPHVGEISAMDMNENMLNEARAKALNAGLEDKVSFKTGTLPALPFNDQSHEVVMFNQVLHHLDIDPEDRFCGIDMALKESARILRKGGLIFINTCSQAQMRSGYWYHALIPQASARGWEGTISAKILKEHLANAGFSNISRTVPLDALLLGEANFNARGPLDATWRAGDSIWAFTTGTELADAVNQVEKMQQAGTLEDFMREHDQPRLQLGQTTFWCAVKTE